MGLLIGIVLLVVEFGTFDIAEILAGVTGGGDVNSGVVTASAFLIFLGAMGKSAQFPLHVWLPDAMEGPTPVSALIHAATMVAAGVFLVARLFPLYEAVGSAQMAVAVVGMVTVLIGGSMALVETDLKRILAYSTVSHLGFMMLALGAGSLTAAIFHLLTHGIAKAMLFLCAGSVMHALNEETDIRKMGGLRRRMPVTAATFTLGALALAGIPPLSAFWSKDEILVAVQEGLNPIFLVLLLGAIVLSALYMARAARVVFFGELAPENAGAHESPLVMSGPLVVLGGLTLVMGVIALPVGGFGGIGSFLAGHEFAFSSLWAVVGTALALGGLGLGWRLYSGPPVVLERIQARFSGLHRLIAERYYMDAAYQWAIDQVVLRVSGAVAWFDRRVVNDRVVNGTGLTVVEAGRRLRYHVTGLFADYGMAMVAGAGAIAVFLWLQA